MTRIRNRTWPPPGDPRIEDADGFLRAAIVKPDGSAASVENGPWSAGYGLTSEHLAEGAIQQVLLSRGDYLLPLAMDLMQIAHSGCNSQALSVGRGGWRPPAYGRPGDTVSRNDTVSQDHGHAGAALRRGDGTRMEVARRR